MPRMTRIKLADPGNGYYHVISRSVLKSFLLDDQKKDYFVKLLRKLSQVYFVRTVTFSVLSNHFHLIIGMIDPGKISEEELRLRFDRYYNQGVPQKRRRKYDPSQSARLRERWSDLSCFVQDLKQRFSRWYNRQTNGQGYIWSDRFKSVLLQSGRALLACAVYVDLNSVRAGLVERPEDYEFCALSIMKRGGRDSRWLDQGPIETALAIWGIKFSGPKDYFLKYREILYRRGKKEQEGKGSISKDIAAKVLADVSFQQRIRHFSEGLVLGSREYCAEKFLEFRSYFRRTRELSGHLLVSPRDGIPADADIGNLLVSLYSLRKPRN
jgi:putative transposase